MIKSKGFIALGLTALLLALAMGGLKVWSQDHFFVKISGGSMYPTLKNGQIATFTKVEGYPTGSLAIFKIPDDWKAKWLGNDNDSLLKRIAAHGGDRLSWDGEAWYVNGVFISRVLKGGCDVAPFKERVLAANELFVAGDVINNKTLDSRQAFCFGLANYLVDTATVEHVGKLDHTFF